MMLQTKTKLSLAHLPVRKAENDSANHDLFYTFVVRFVINNLVSKLIMVTLFSETECAPTPRSFVTITLHVMYFLYHSSPFPYISYWF